MPTDNADNFQWSLKKLQAYIIHVKTLNPVTTEPANKWATIPSPSPLMCIVQSDV